MARPPAKRVDRDENDVLGSPAFGLLLGESPKNALKLAERRSDRDEPNSQGEGGCRIDLGHHRGRALFIRGAPGEDF